MDDDRTDGPPGGRSVEVGCGRTLVVRRACADDLGPLMELYEALSFDDLHRRFFLGHVPPRSFFERWVCIGEHGGCLLVAELRAEGSRRILADAGFTRMPDGDGELALTVDPAWRGWLGPFMLDALLDEAAAAGLENLQADVLIENQPMLALMRSRGMAVVDRPDWGQVRVTVPTSGRDPGWPPAHDRPRVLVEARRGRWRHEAAVRAAGFEVITCAGPEGRARQACPALEGRTCPLAEGADVIVLVLPLDAPDAAVDALGDGAGPLGAELLRVHGLLHGGVPLVVQTRAFAGDGHAPSMAPDADPASVIGAIRELAGE